MTTVNNITYGSIDIVIANNGTTSGAADLSGLTLLGFIMPSAFTGTSISFTISPDNATFTALYNTNNQLLTATIAVSRAYLFSPGDFIAARYVKFVSGATEGGSRTITLLTRSFA